MSANKVAKIYLLHWLHCSGDISMDVLPSECVDAKPSDPSPILQFLHIDLDNSEISEDVNDSLSMCTDSPKSKGIFFNLVP